MEIANQDLVKVLSRANECMRRLIEAGLTYEDLQTPITDPEMRKNLVDFWRKQTPEKRSPKVDASNDLILDSFKSLDSCRYSYGKEAVRASGDEILKFRKLNEEYCQKMLEIVMNRVKNELTKKYLFTHISNYINYEDWYNFRCKDSTKVIKTLCDVIRECIYQLLQNERIILGLPSTNFLEEKENNKLIGILKYFGYKICKHEHEEVMNVGGIIIFRSKYESKEKFTYLKVTSHNYRDPMWDN